MHLPSEFKSVSKELNLDPDKKGLHYKIFQEGFSLCWKYLKKDEEKGKMKIEIKMKKELDIGDVFSIKGRPQEYLFMVVDNSEMMAARDSDMTPIRVINICTGRTVARSTSLNLCLRDMDVGKANIEIHGQISWLGND